MKNRKFKVIRKEYWEMETIIEAPTADKAEEMIKHKVKDSDIDSVMEKENAVKLFLDSISPTVRLLGVI